MQQTLASDFRGNSEQEGALCSDSHKVIDISEMQKKRTCLR